MVNIQLWPDREMCVEKRRINHVPALILTPAEKTSCRVGLLWIHGGGYVTGMKEMVYMGRGIDLLKQFGVTVFAPGYRLAVLHPYPAALEDCYAVLRYMDQNREALGFDRIMIGGESAGGGLTAAVCMKARDEGIHIAFQMPLYPMLSNLDTDSSRDNHGRVWNTTRNHLGWQAYLRGDAKGAVSPYASAAQQTDYSHLPPCYTFVGDGEPFYQETLDYVRHLRETGVEAEVDVYHSDLHAFDIYRPEDEISIQAVSRFNDRFAYALEHYR